jgi:hypothetical protein
MCGPRASDVPHHYRIAVYHRFVLARPKRILVVTKLGRLCISMLYWDLYLHLPFNLDLLWK